VQVVGIIQEQHPDRARLFMQWKRMDWPILVDSLNLLGTSLVPVTLFIDERGIIREVSPPLAEAQERIRDFLQQDFGEADHEVAAADALTANTDALVTDQDIEALRVASASGTVGTLRSLADGLLMWGDEENLDESIAVYERALRADAKDGKTHFRAGVAYRRRSESSQRQADDFSTAVRHWEAALDIDPNNYIWRRRIQQYGPRLEKPYPFYDWVDVARQEIVGRGEEPVMLRVEPRGAEIAQPLEKFRSSREGDEPDPTGRILRDQGEFIDLEVTVVPARVAPGMSTRVHLVFRPRLAAKAHWNNEVDDLAVWVTVPAGWSANAEYLTAARPPEIVSQEERRVELELLAGASAAPGPRTISAYALYYVCEDVHGVCLYRRQDLSIGLEILPAQASSR
jgi:tetratricopeptide (TPR) repeat protein